MITFSEPWVKPFTGLSLRAFRRLVGQVRRRGGAQIASGPARSAAGAAVGGSGAAGRGVLADQPNDAPDRSTVGISHAAAHRVIDTIGPLLALPRCAVGTPPRRPSSMGPGPHAGPLSRHPKHELPAFRTSCLIFSPHSLGGHRSAVVGVPSVAEPASASPVNRGTGEPQPPPPSRARCRPRNVTDLPTAVVALTSGLRLPTTRPDRTDSGRVGWVL